MAASSSLGLKGILHVTYKGLSQTNLVNFHVTKCSAGISPKVILKMVIAFRGF